MELFTITWQHWLVLVSAGISLSGAIQYIRDMLRGTSKPNLMTWGLWSAAPLIATGAAVSADADAWATVRIFMSGFAPLLVFLSAFFIRQSFWKLQKFDIGCGLFSIIALYLWLLADSPIAAILFAAIADLLATVPTVLKAWKHPETETLYTYLAGLITAVIVIPAIPVWNIENSAFQIYLLLANIALVAAVGRNRITAFFRKSKLTS